MIELALRLLPVNTGLQNRAVNADQPILRAESHSAFVYSKNWNLQLVNAGEVNNDGFLSDIDYTAAHDNIVVVGDSYVQAAAVPTSRNLAAELRHRLGTVDVLALGASGANLPDYVAAIRWAGARYRPRAYVVVLTEGDVRDAFTARAGGYTFDSAAGASCEVRLHPWTPARSGVAGMLKHLRLTHYLLENLRAGEQLRAAFRRGTGSYGAGPDDMAAREALRHAAGCFVEQMTQAVSGVPVLFVAHGLAGAGDDRWPLLHLLEQNGRLVLDLTPIFAAHVRQTGRRLDFLPTDAHWNEEAQAVAADAVVPWVRQALQTPSRDAGPP
jgi:hypothetical protein